MSAGKALRWVWWILWFEFPVFIGLVIVTAMGIAHPGPWLAWSPLLAVVTALQVCTSKHVITSVPYAGMQVHAFVRVAKRCTVHSTITVEV